MLHVSLICHPATPSRHARSIDVRIAPEPGGELRLTYTLTGDISQIAVPETAAPQRLDGLWRHTCFEAFLMLGHGPDYREYNFAPSGDWAAYTLRGYRQDAHSDPMPPPAIDCRVCDTALVLEARLPRQSLPHVTGLRLGLSAVVEDRDGTLSYWALHHPSDKPDFHHTDAFALDLDLP